MTEESTDKLIDKAQDYVDAIRRFDLVVTEEGTRYMISEALGPEHKETVKRAYSEWLSLRMTVFETWKTWKTDSLAGPTRREATILFMSEINRGLTGGLLKQGQGLVAKWEKAEADNRELRAKLTKLIRQFRRCSDNRIELSNQVQDLGQKPVTVGYAESEVETTDNFDIREYDKFEDK